MSVSQTTLSMKSDHDQVATATYKSNIRRISLILMALLIGLTLILPLCLNTRDSYYPVAGGLVGFVCSATVMIEYYRKRQYRGPPLALLFWRSVADFGIAIRFIATPGFNELICGKESCDFTKFLHQERNCSFASAMFEFFDIFYAF